MAQFRIKTNENKILCPNEMDNDEKKLLYEKCKNGKVKLFCNCNGVSEYKAVKGNKQITRIGVRNRKYS